MAFSSLRDFIFDHLEPRGKLIRVLEPVRPFLEMTEIQTRLLAEGGPAVLFENPIREDGTPMGFRFWLIYLARLSASHGA